MSESTEGFVEEGGVVGPLGSTIEDEANDYPEDNEPQDNDAPVEPDAGDVDLDDLEEDDPDASEDAPNPEEAAG